MEKLENAAWRKSSFSGTTGNCVEVAGQDGTVFVRDSKDNGHGPVHRCTTAEWRAFVAGIRNREFLDESDGMVTA
jgi:hypothetical protein